MPKGQGGEVLSTVVPRQEDSGFESGSGDLHVLTCQLCYEPGCTPPLLQDAEIGSNATPHPLPHTHTN